MDPIRDFEHSHARLTSLALEIGRQLRGGGGHVPGDRKQELVAHVEALRDDLLQHFADEEDGLFPFLRANVPAKVEVVERLEADHDTICGCLVRMAHLAARDGAGLGDHSLVSLYERFEQAYAGHSRTEAELFQELGDLLAERQRAELASLLHGLGDRRRT